MLNHNQTTYMFDQILSLAVLIIWKTVSYTCLCLVFIKYIPYYNWEMSGYRLADSQEFRRATDGKHKLHMHDTPYLKCYGNINEINLSHL